MQPAGLENDAADDVTSPATPILITSTIMSGVVLAFKRPTPLRGHIMLEQCAVHFAGLYLAAFFNHIAPRAKVRQEYGIQLTKPSRTKPVNRSRHNAPALIDNGAAKVWGGMFIWKLDLPALKGRDLCFAFEYQQFASGHCERTGTLNYTY